MQKDICSPVAYALAGTPTATLMGLCLYGIERRGALFKHDEQSVRLAAARNQQYWIHRTFRALCHLSSIHTEFHANEACSELLHSNTPLLVLSNHRSFVDILAIGSLLQEHGRTDVRWVIKREIERWPFIGRSCKVSGSLFVSRDKTRANLSEIHRIDAMAKTAREDGADVVLFPEGTRFKEADPNSDLRHTLEPNPLIVARFLKALPHHPILSLTLSADATPCASHGGMFRINANIVEQPRSLSPKTIRQWLLAEWQSKDALLGRARTRAAERLG